MRQLEEAVEVGVGVCMRFVCALYRMMRGGDWGRWQVSSGGLLDMIWWRYGGEWVGLRGD